MICKKIPILSDKIHLGRKILFYLMEYCARLLKSEIQKLISVIGQWAESSASDRLYKNSDFQILKSFVFGIMIYVI